MPGDTQELSQKHVDYFAMDREAVFLHLNKTTVVSTENIWFSAYSYNPKLYKASAITTNLHVNLYNDQGKLMEAKTVFMENGQGAGYFELDSLTPPGTYLIKASTKYMENFREDLSFSQTFTILGKTDIPEVPIKYDLQLLPEGGHLIANVANTIGVKLIDNTGKGVFFTGGKVLNGQQEVVNTFKSNKFGLSKFQLVPKINEAYMVVLTTEHGKDIRKKIAAPEVRGIALSTNAMLPKEIIFSVKTNQKTYEHIKNTTFFMAIHKDGRMRTLSFIIPEKSLTANIRIPKKALYTGMNTFTIFDQHFNPVSERLIFNNEGLKRKNITADYKKMKRDSLILSLKSLDSLGLHSLSISVLPAGTKAYQPNNGIFSALYIEPYITGNLEDGGYYFSDKTPERRRNYDLDLLLLTQGWSKYSWKDIFNNTPKEYFEPEQGFTILGKISDRNEKKENQAFVKSQENDLFAIVNLKEDGSFRLENVFLKDSSSVSIGLINNKNNKTSKNPVYIRVLPTKDDLQNSEIKNETVAEEKNHPSEALEQKPIVPDNFLKNAVSLGYIYLQGEKRKKTDYSGEAAFSEKVIITKDLAKSFTYVTNLIRFHGYTVVRKATSVLVYSERGASFSGPLPTLIVLDNMPLRSNDQLIYLQTKDVESITFNKTGGGYGSQAPGGVIRIKTSKDYYSSRNNIETTSVYIAKNGFATNKEFYAPKYTSYTKGYFADYGVIDWFPSMNLNKNGETTFRVYNTLQPKINLYIEGMTAEGALISETITLEIK
ncbi:MAG TPA: hypothetical protein VFM65_00465 [Flavobacteriaceae bacterium]|nr:hypothetical protein [Flavobacteriaceae bacterium]